MQIVAPHFKTVNRQIHFEKALLASNNNLLKVMRGRWASAALGAGLARRQASYEMEQQAQAYEAQQYNHQM
jgi:hypothetical protein